MSNKTLKGMLWVSATTATLLSQTVLAQAPTLEEIVVTSTKQGETNIMETPLTIQAMTAEALENRGATDFSDIARQISGLGVADQGPGTKRYGLRGVYAFGAGTVGVLVDDVVITGENSNFSGGGMQPDPRLYDIERVEVLKGPQGTTFGSSSLSGVIRYITNKPELNELSGSFRSSVNFMEGADPGFSVDSALNLPVVDDKFAIRLSGFYQDRPGYLDNRYQDGASGEDTYSGRAQAKWQITDRASLSAMAMTQEANFGLQYYNTADFYGNPVPRHYQSAIERGGTKDEMDLYNLTFEYDVGVGTVVASASRHDRHMHIYGYASQVLAASARIADPETLGIASTLLNERTRTIDSYELRFASDWDAPVQLLAGVSYQEDDRQNDVDILTVDQFGYPNPLSGVLFGPVLQDRVLYTNVKEQAVFAEATWQATDRWKFVLGTRAFEFDNESIGYVTTGLLGSPGTGYGPAASSEESGLISRVIGSYELAPGSIAYAQVSQGYRPGGTNDQAAASLGGATVPEGYQSDELVNYELGLKLSSPSYGLTSTLAVFYVDWSDIQVSLRTPVTPTIRTQYGYIGNAGEARSYGLELENHWRPVDGLDLSLTAAYTNAEVTETVVGAGVEGDRIPYTPEYTANLGVDYSFPVGSVEGFVGGDLNWMSDRPTNFPSAGASYTLLEEQTLVNLRTGAQINDWRVALLVRNLLDDDTVTDILFQQPYLTSYYRVTPRAISLEVSTKF